MNEQEIKDLLVAAVNARELKRHQEILDNPVELARYKEYYWWNETFEPQDFDELGWSEILYDISGATVEVNDFVVKGLEHVGGEGEGDHMHFVFSVTDGKGTRYFRRNGYWVSYDGPYWDDDDFYEVTPKTRTVTYYE